MINIIKDKDLIYEVFNYDVILVGTHINCGLYGGFQYDIRINFPIVQEENIKTKYGDRSKIGTIVSIKDRGLIFCLCFMNYGRYRPDLKKEFIDYDGLRNCLLLVNKQYKGKNIATTFMGTTIFDGDGDKDKILEIFNEACTDINLTIYDYQQLSRNERKYLLNKEIDEAVGTDDYYRIKKENLWKLKHGIWNNELKN